ncbi:hypothetical protein UlMin_040341 [Ulmus minor]
MIDDFHTTLKEGVEATQSALSPNTTPSYNADENNKEIEIVPVEGEKKRKQISVVWNHFTKRNFDGLWKAICNYCDKKLGGESKNGTRHLHDHFKRYPLRTQRHISQSILNPNKKVDGKSTLGTYNFDPEEARKKLAQMIIRNEYSLSMVDYEGFVEYSNNLQPMFKVVTSNQKKRYMVVTAHYIDDSWILQSKILRYIFFRCSFDLFHYLDPYIYVFKYFLLTYYVDFYRFMYVPCPHNAETISDALMGCLMDWNVDRKLSTLIVDNCTNNDAAIPIMKDKLFSSGLMLSGDFFHMRCAAHILNLIVKDEMSILDKGFVNIHESVSYWTTITKRNEKFMETTRQLHIQSTRILSLDMPVRWNSTYVMLSSALIYKYVFAHLKQRESVLRMIG